MTVSLAATLINYCSWSGTTVKYFVHGVNLTRFLRKVACGTRTSCERQWPYFRCGVFTCSRLTHEQRRMVQICCSSSELLGELKSSSCSHSDRGWAIGAWLLADWVYWSDTRHHVSGVCCLWHGGTGELENEKHEIRGNEVSGTDQVTATLI